MAFPIVGDTNSSINNGLQTSHVANLPANIVANDLLFLEVSLSSSSAPISTPAGWTSLDPVVGNTNSRLFAKVADGSEGATVTCSSGEGTGRHWATRSFRITAASWDFASGLSAVQAVRAGTYDPPSNTPPWGALDTLWFAIIGVNHGHNNLATGPTNYTNYVEVGCASTDTNVHAANAWTQRNLNATSDDPSAFSGSGAGVNTWTVAIKPAATPVVSTPGTATLVLTSFAPTVLTPRLVTPGVASLTLTPFAPVVSAGVRAVPGTASLSLVTFAPTIINPKSATPGTRVLVLTTYAPSVIVPVVGAAVKTWKSAWEEGWI